MGFDRVQVAELVAWIHHDMRQPPCTDDCLGCGGCERPRARDRFNEVLIRFGRVLIGFNEVLFSFNRVLICL